jgi:hypothetical protein
LNATVGIRRSFVRCVIIPVGIYWSPLNFSSILRWTLPAYALRRAPLALPSQAYTSVSQPHTLPVPSIHAPYPVNPRSLFRHHTLFSSYCFPRCVDTVSLPCRYAPLVSLCPVRSCHVGRQSHDVTSFNSCDLVWSAKPHLCLCLNPTEHPYYPPRSLIMHSSADSNRSV